MVFDFIPHIGDPVLDLSVMNQVLILNNGWSHIVETEAEVPHILTAFHLRLSKLSVVGFALKC